MLSILIPYLIVPQHYLFILRYYHQPTKVYLLKPLMVNLYARLFMTIIDYGFNLLYHAS